MNISFNTILIIALVALIMIRWIRGNVGWQQLRPGKIVPKMITFLIVGLAFFALGIFHPASLISNLAGIVIGVILANYGLAKTDFEQRDRSWHFRPNTWIGTGVMILFFLRVISRAYTFYANGGLHTVQTASGHDFHSIGSTIGMSWTSGLTLITFAYYIVYYVKVLLKQRQGRIRE